MSVAPRLQHEFSGVVRHRGREYARTGRVAIAALDTDRIEAHVRGSGRMRWLVRMTARDGESLAATCACPHFARGQACKHLWATLLVLDARGWEPPVFAGSLGRLALVGLGWDDEQDALDPEDEDEEEDPFFDDLTVDDLPERDRVNIVPLRPAPRPPAPSSRRAATPPAAGGWQARIGRLASGLAGRARSDGEAHAHAALAGASVPLLYLLDPEEAIRRGELRVHFARRPLLRDGTPGALRSVRIGQDEIDAAASAAEVAVLMQLLQLAHVELALARPYSYGWAPTRAYGPRPTSVAIPVAFVDPLLARLAETGRLGVLAGGIAAQAAARGPEETPPEPRWLRLDPGPPWELRIRLARAGQAYALEGRYARGDEELALDAADLVLAGGFLVRGDVLARAEVGGNAAPVSELRRGPLQIPARDLDRALGRLARTAGLPPLELAPEVPWSERPGAPVPRVRFAPSEPGARELRARVDFGYGGAWIDADDPAPNVAERASRTLWRRDAAAEAGALATLGSLGARPASAPASGTPAAPLAFDAAQFEPAVGELLAKGWIVEAEGGRLRRPGASWASVRSGIDFFELEGGIDYDGASAPFPELLAAARDGARFVRLGDGTRGLLPRAWLERCAALAELGQPEGDGLHFARAHIGVVDALLAAQDTARVDDRFGELRRRLVEFRGIEPAPEPEGFRGALRPYQREGLGWLRFLREFGLGGCLADDMGLGKTVQVLAVLAGRGGRRGPALVVAPKSVVHGWVEEAARFAPGLDVVRYTGLQRAGLRERAGACDLLVTTYGTLRRDLGWLCEQRFDTVVLDEAQAIKNARSRTAQAARALVAEHRLALTGTPVENHLGELGSLLDFLNPGFLGRARGLEALATRVGDPAAMAVLARALRPILLRRTKEQVLADLPPKTEQTLVCELPPAQRRQYDELRRHYQASIQRRVETQGLARSKIHVLEALLRLRQAACHPALLDPKRAGEGSAKLAVLFEQLEKVLVEGHKALVFSQFTRLLALVRRGLEARGIEHAYLDGRTRDRKAAIARFQEDARCRVFAISLKAGGTGLNLTAADYVFLLDPWWNPAVEAQAVDRTHRIGQTRPVMAYRLVAEDTVEEKILALQAHKRALASSIFGDEKSFVGSLTAEDLALLLA
jgi:superfamily II DNA or RNA helicase